MFQLEKITHLGSALESKGSQIKQIEWDAYSNRYAEASRRLQDAKLASLKKNLLQKTNEKCKTQEEVPKTKHDKTDMTPSTPLYSPLPSIHFLLILYLNCLSTLFRVNNYLLKKKTT